MAVILKLSGNMDSVFGKSQYPISQYIQQQAESFEGKSQIEEIFQVDKANSFGEKLSYETSLGDFSPVGENGATPESDFMEGYSKNLEYETWKNSFTVSKEMIEDANIGKVKEKSGSFMLSYYRTKEKFGASILSGGISTTMTFGGKTFDIACADGQPLFSKSHPSKTGKVGVQSNLYEGSYSYDNLAKIETLMQNYTDDDGNLLNIMPDTIIIPNNALLKKQIIEDLNGEGNPNSANLKGNYHMGRWNVIIWPYLTAPTGVTAGNNWFIVADLQWNKVYNGLVWRDRVALEVTSIIDDKTDANVWKGRARFGATPNNWRPFALCAEGLSGTAL